MTVLTELRTELAGMLADAGMDVSEYVPEAVNPPLAIVTMGEPWIQEVFDVKTFNHDYKVNMKVRLVAGQEDNEAVTAELDDLVETFLVALRGAWEAEVSMPFRYDVNSNFYLATDATISTSITIA